MAEKSCQVIRDEITGQIDEPVNGWAVASGFTVSPCPVTLMYGALWQDPVKPKSQWNHLKVATTYNYIWDELW